MDPIEIASGLAKIQGRAPGSDAERRAAARLRRELRSAGREVDVETVWVRPEWPALHLLHATLGVAGSVLALSHPTAALALLVAVLVAAALDLLGIVPVLRRLTPERATQNLVSGPTAATRSGAQRLVRLVIVAHYDAPRDGLVRRDAIRRPAAAAQRLARGRLPGAMGMVTLALATLAGVAATRRAGVEAGWLEVVQLVPTLVLLAALGALLDLGLSGPGPGAGESASAAAVALALATTLDRSPPRHLAVEVVLAGAGHGPSLGMRAFVRARRRRYRAESTAVLELKACGRGRPRWWTSDGPLVARRLHPRLGALCSQAASEHPDLEARPHRGHEAGAAWRARLAGWPAIAVGCLDDHDLVPAAGRPQDTADRLDPAAMRAALELCRELVERLDADLGSR